MSQSSPAPADQPAEGGVRGRGSVDAAILERIGSRLAPVGEPGETIAVEIPFTGDTLGGVPHAMPADVRAAALRARDAQPGWASTPFDERAQAFLRFHDLLLEQRDEVLDLVQLETGKARAHAYEEVADAAVVARYYALHGWEHLKPRRRRGAIPGLTVAWEHRHPVGLVGLIAPWNYPLSLAISDSIPALLAGNAALLKPDPKTPFTALWAVDLLYRAGLPADLLQVVVGDEDTGSAVVEEVDYLSFTAATRSLRLGPALDFSVDIGSLTSREQLEKVEAHVRDAVAKGARLLEGGRARPEIGPYFFEPTILTDVTAEMELCDQETFGPVVSVYAFESVDEAIDRANATPYGLNASVWTRDAVTGRRVASRIRAGTVNVNEAYAAAWGSVDAPMGGVKDSGVGRRHGAEGIRKYTEAQTIAVQRGLPLAAPPWLDEERYSRIMTRALRVLKRTPGLR